MALIGSFGLMGSMNSIYRDPVDLVYIGISTFVTIFSAIRTILIIKRVIKFRKSSANNKNSIETKKDKSAQQSDASETMT